MNLQHELRVYLDTLQINGDNIGDIRRSLFVPWESAWNGIVRDETAKRERRMPQEEDGPDYKTQRLHRIYEECIQEGRFGNEESDKCFLLGLLNEKTK